MRLALHNPWRCLPSLMMVWCVALVGCGTGQSGARVAYWAAADGVYPDQGETERDDALFDRAGHRIQLTSAINETVAFRLWVSYSGATGGEVSVTVDDWQSGPTTLVADAVTIYRVEAVRVSRWPGWHIRSIEPGRRRELVEDALIPADAPRGGLPHGMSDGDTLSLWVDVAVPKGTRPGVFWSKLRVRSDGETMATADLRLEVLPFVLPDRADVVLAADLDQAALFAHHVTYQGKPCQATRIMADNQLRSELQSVLDASVRQLHAHKVAPLLPNLYPVIKIDAFDEISVRWEDYDRTVEGYFDGTKFIDRVPLPIGVVPFDEHFPAPPTYGAMQSPGYSRHLRQYLKCCADHFAERGWLARSFVEIPYADFPSPQSVQASEHFARVIRKADARLRVLSDLFPQDLGPYGWPDFPTGDLLGYVDIWCPPAQFYTPPVPIGGVTPADMWMRVDRPPFSGSIALAAPAADTRVLPWQAYRAGAKVIRLGAVNCWPDVTEGLTAKSVAEAPLIYPGSIAGLTEPIPSVRLKRLRRGMLDLAYLKLMREKGLGHVADVLAESLAPFAGAQAYRYHYADTHAEGWVRDPRLWREARQIIIDELKRVLGRNDPDRHARMTANVQWRRFMDAVRQIRVEIEGVRVRRVAPAALGNATIECAVVIHNGKRTAVSGSIDFGTLPIGWSGLDSPVKVFVPPGDSVRVILTAEAAVVTWDDDGVRPVPIEFRTDQGKVFRLTARMSYIAAQSWYRDIRIDGDLSDWPPGVGNLASDFVLITGEPSDRPRDKTSRPTSGVRVYVIADAKALYFAFDCATEGASSMLPAHSNVVDYDDLIPVGEELVEIVLDPTGAGTHSTSDLYHLVVKPSGAMWEHGIGTNPPTGRRRVWAADIRHAARTYPDRWVAEVRIPFEAFGEGSATGRIWSVNFSRFDRTRQEYSNWAGARRNFYDPASLGNLALP